MEMVSIYILLSKDLQPWTILHLWKLKGEIIWIGPANLYVYVSKPIRI